MRNLMKKSFQLKAAFLFAFALLVSVVTFAQDKPASPRDSVSGKAAGSTITINYGSPSVKGRKIWGGLEAYGKVWRAGANEATTFTTTKDIKVEGKTLAAGTYGFFLIPAENGTWTVIFNKVAKQWGAFKYDESKDALRVDVKTKAAPMHERLVYTVDAKSFCLFWDKIVVPVSVK
jgi:hypothetical protein